MPPPPSISGSSNTPSGKLLLPPLSKSSISSASKNSEKARTSHACDHCRRSKSKCSGRRPCDRCSNEGKKCVYGDGKRDKEKKKLETVVQDNKHLVSWNKKLAETLKHVLALEKISPQDVSEASRLLSQYAGAEPDYHNSEGEADHQSQGTRAMNEDSYSDDDDRNVDSNTASTTRRSSVGGALGRGERPGVHQTERQGSESSAVAWIQTATMRANKSLEEVSPDDGTPTVSNVPYAASCLHTEDRIFQHYPSNVDPFVFPPRELANALIDLYFAAVHQAFPILCKQEFIETFESFRSESSRFEELTDQQQNWLCTLNLVFAIGSHYGNITGHEWCRDDQDHLFYHARAQNFGMNARTLYSMPDIKQTVCLALLGVYLMTTDRLNKAWTFVGMAVRNAVAIGLHIEVGSGKTFSAKKELRVRLWWSLYCLERLLSEFLGRPSAISNRDIGTPMPLNIDETFIYDNLRGKAPPSSSTASSSRAQKGKGRAPPLSPPDLTTSSPMKFMLSPDSPPAAVASFSITQLTLTPSTYFVYRTQLSILSHEILTRLYCASLTKTNWSDIQSTMRQIDTRLKSWKKNLCDEYNFDAPKQDRSEEHVAVRLGLELFYHSSRMTLFRPCLCRIDGRLREESQNPKSYTSRAASDCVKSARSVFNALPSNNVANVFSITPWWNTVHYIIEAASVLMLELAYRAEHVPSKSSILLEDCKKAIKWLSALSNHSNCARKGCEIFHGLLNLIASKTGDESYIMPMEIPDQIGPTWTNYNSNFHPVTTPQLASFQQQQSGYSAIDLPSSTRAWVEQSAYMMTSPTQQQQQSGILQGADIMQTFGSALQPFNPAGHVLGLHDQFGPWNNTLSTGDISQEQPDLPLWAGMGDVFLDDTSGLRTTTNVSTAGLQGRSQAQTTVPGQAGVHPGQGQQGMQTTQPMVGNFAMDRYGNWQDGGAWDPARANPEDKMQTDD